MKRIHFALVANPLAGAFVAWACHDFLDFALIFRSISWSVFAALTPFALLQAILVVLRKSPRNSLRVDAAIVLASIVALAAFLAALNANLAIVKPLLVIVVFAAWCVCIPAMFWTIVDAIGLSRSSEFVDRHPARLAGFLLAIVVAFAAGLSFGTGCHIKNASLEFVFNLWFINRDTRPIFIAAPYAFVFFGLLAACGGSRQVFLLSVGSLLFLYSIPVAAFCSNHHFVPHLEDVDNPLLAGLFNNRPVVIDSGTRALSIALVLPWCFLPLWFMIWSFDWLDLIYTRDVDPGASAAGGDPTRSVVSSGR